MSGTRADELIPLVVEDDGVSSFLMKIVDDDTEYNLKFEVYEVNSWTENEETGAYGVTCDLELYLSGTIKWDGCSHVFFGEKNDKGNPSGYLHLCGRKYWEKHCRVMSAIYEYAENAIERYAAWLDDDREPAVGAHKRR